MQEFISEDDLRTFEGWLRYQVVNPATPEELGVWRRYFEVARERCATHPKIGLMKLQPVPGEHRYAVAVREDSDLWLTLWVRRSRKGEFFIMRPVGDRDWDPHTSYHLNGTLHMKSHGRTVLSPQKRQPLTGPFLPPMEHHLPDSPHPRGCHPGAPSAAGGAAGEDPGAASAGVEAEGDQPGARRHQEPGPVRDQLSSEEGAACGP